LRARRRGIGSVAGRPIQSLAVIGISAYNLDMSSQFDDLTKRIQALSPQEKAALVRMLIDDLDPGQDPEIEKLWIEEAERRYAQYLRGEVEAIPGDEVMAEARKRLK
jgi:putative addiction module component (TIGR02574 family)